MPTNSNDIEVDIDDILEEALGDSRKSRPRGSIFRGNPEPVVEGGDAPELTQEEDEQPKDPEFDIKTKPTKSQKLFDKVNKLIEKIEKEKSPFIRHLLSFKVKLLRNRIQREIDLQNIKENSEATLEELKYKKEKFESESIDTISELAALIKSKERQLRANEEYDTESPYFIYPKKYVEQSGGVQALTDKLKQSQNPESQRAAKKIEDANKLRTEIEELSNQLADKQKELDDSGNIFKKEEERIKRQELALTVVNKVNIFARIGNFFRTFGEQAKEYFAERRENKEIKAQQKKEEAELYEQYAEVKAQLEAQYKEAKAQLHQQYAEDSANRQAQNSRSAAQSFRDSLHHQDVGEQQPQQQGAEPAQEAPQQGAHTQSAESAKEGETNSSQGDGR